MERMGNKGQCDDVHQRHEAVNLECDNHRLLKRKASVFPGFVDPVQHCSGQRTEYGREGLLLQGKPFSRDSNSLPIKWLVRTV